MKTPVAMSRWWIQLSSEYKLHPIAHPLQTAYSGDCSSSWGGGGGEGWRGANAPLLGGGGDGECVGGRYGCTVLQHCFECVQFTRISLAYVLKMACLPAVFRVCIVGMCYHIFFLMRVTVE